MKKSLQLKNKSYATQIVESLAQQLKSTVCGTNITPNYIQLYDLSHNIFNVKYKQLAIQINTKHNNIIYYFTDFVKANNQNFYKSKYIYIPFIPLNQKPFTLIENTFELTQNIKPTIKIPISCFADGV